MVIKIDKEDNQSDSFDPPPSKKQKGDKGTPSKQQPAAVEKEAAVPLVCYGCKVSDKEASGPLLLFDDPEEDDMTISPSTRSIAWWQRLNGNYRRKSRNLRQGMRNS